MSAKLLDAVTVVGAGSTRQTTRGFVSHSVQVTATGSPSAVTIDLEGSLDGVTWFQLAQQIFTAAEITAGAALFHKNDKLVQYVKLNLITLTGGTNPTITGLWTGF